MTNKEQEFMTHMALIQWTQAIVTQAERISEANRLIYDFACENPNMMPFAQLKFHAECHFFVIAAYKLVEASERAISFGLRSEIDFSEIKKFSMEDIKDLRNMHEHVFDYQDNKGRSQKRWEFKTPLYSADASSVVDNLIGGRLDWIKFSEAAGKLKAQLVAEPIPYPPLSEMSAYQFSTTV